MGMTIDDPGEVQRKSRKKLKGKQGDNIEKSILTGEIRLLKKDQAPKIKKDRGAWAQDCSSQLARARSQYVTSRGPPSVTPCDKSMDACYLRDVMYPWIQCKEGCDWLAF